MLSEVEALLRGGCLAASRPAHAAQPEPNAAGTSQQLSGSHAGAAPTALPEPTTCTTAGQGEARLPAQAEAGPGFARFLGQVTAELHRMQAETVGPKQ